jgi:hypothetical protein
MLLDGDEHSAQWPYLAINADQWMTDAKPIAVAGCRQVLEDGPDVCNSESDAEYIDHGEELTGMHIEGTTLASARLTTEQGT